MEDDSFSQILISNLHGFGGLFSPPYSSSIYRGPNLGNDHISRPKGKARKSSTQKCRFGMGICDRSPTGYHLLVPRSQVCSYHQHIPGWLPSPGVSGAPNLSFSPKVPTRFLTSKNCQVGIFLMPLIFPLPFIPSKSLPLKKPYTFKKLPQISDNQPTPVILEDSGVPKKKHSSFGCFQK